MQGWLCLSGGLPGHGPVADREFVAVPAAAGIGEVENILEVKVELGFARQTPFTVIVVLPQKTVVVF